MVQKDIPHSSFSANQQQYEFQDHPIDPVTSSLTGNSLHDSQLPVPTVSYLIHYKIVGV